LTGKTLQENLRYVDAHRSRIDLAELRVDCLEADEKFHVREFPAMAGLPVILTVRRKCDGGRFEEGEGVRLVILAKGLAYASTDPRKNFAYVDLESDLHAPAIEEAARTFGTRIIRSAHVMNGLPPSLDLAWKELTRDSNEIPKLSVMPRNASEAARFASFFLTMPPGPRIPVAMGEYGFFSRILVKRLGGTFGYASVVGGEKGAPGQVTPDELEYVYGFRQLKGDEAVYGLVGNPVAGSQSPILHNSGFRTIGAHSIYVPCRADSPEDFFELADALSIKGASVTVPFKERIVPHLVDASTDVRAIGACNTIARGKGGWCGWNTDSDGFESAILEFSHRKSLHGLKVAVIGAGGIARAIAHSLHRLGAKACVVNRTMTKAKKLAERYGFEWSSMDENAVRLLDRYRDLIVQATPVGMEGGPQGDPLEWYEFSGREIVYDAVYKPAETVLLRRARAAGCKVTNGLQMLIRQAAGQFESFTGHQYPEKRK
jgi:3-dehydroquinate dehydratase/shikimate dehydrogenase